MITTIMELVACLKFIPHDEGQDRRDATRGRRANIGAHRLLRPTAILCRIAAPQPGPQIGV
jgi:hypothetical protein